MTVYLKKMVGKDDVCNLCAFNGYCISPLCKGSNDYFVKTTKDDKEVCLIYESNRNKSGRKDGKRS